MQNLTQATLEFIEALNTATDPDLQRNHLLNTIAEFGYDKAVYGVFPAYPTDTPLEEMFWVSGYPDEWMQRYLENEYMQFNAAVHHCFKSTTPLLWADLFADADAGNLGNRISSMHYEARDFGLKLGVTIPVRDIKGGKGGISFSGSAEMSEIEHVTLWRSNGPMFELYADLFHAFCDRQTLFNNQYELSPRERECLLWLAKGKRTKQIASILGIHIKTIDKQIHAAKRKLNATTTPQAIAKAMALGLITP